MRLEIKSDGTTIGTQITNVERREIRLCTENNLGSFCRGSSSYLHYSDS